MSKASELLNEVNILTSSREVDVAKALGIVKDLMGWSDTAMGYRQAVKNLKGKDKVPLSVFIDALPDIVFVSSSVEKDFKRKMGV